MMAARNQRVQWTILLLTIVITLCLILAAKAAFASEQIDQSNLPEWAGGWTHVNPTAEGRATMWQTFTPACPNLSAVEIDILTVSTGRGDDVLTIEITKGRDILASADCSVEDGFDGLLRFEFPEVVPLVPEQLYELTVRDTGKTRFGWKYGPNTYERGSRYVFAQERPNYDWFFRTYSKVEQAGAKYSGGTGEPNDPYQIATAEDLMLMGDSPEDYNKHFILTDDIDLDPSLPGCKVFDKAVIAPPISLDTEGHFQGTPFTGVFDGNGHTILHLTIQGQDYLGLFGYLESGTQIKNLAVVDVNITSSGNFVGGLAGSNSGGSITTSYSTGAVSGSSYYVGGLVSANGGSVAHCYSTCKVSGEKYYVGGLVGNNYHGTVTACYSTGMVSGTSSVGGLVGYNSATLTYCYSTGTATGNGRVGGLVGGNHEGDVIQCYSTGAVSGGQNVGGLMGTNDGPVSACFWDIQTSGQVASAGGTGKTTAEMQTANTFLEAGWDFVGETTNGTEDIWWILEGKDYPRLWWERTVWFPDYMPLDPNEYGIKTFEWVYGQTGEYTSRIGGSDTVPYLSGPITGVQIMEDNDTLVVDNDWLNVRFLASGEWFLSIDPNLTAYPPAWSFAELYDGMIIDQGVWYLVKRDISDWEKVDDQQLLIDIQDVTVPEGHHNNSVVFWYLHTVYLFTPLDFHGKEFDLGLTPPSSSQAAGYAVTAFEIYALNTGLIAQGDIDAATGSLNDLAVLRQVE